MGKRYYWLKLKSDFFTSKRIKKLRNMAGGDTYTIIYLKMQLLAIKSDGVLSWTGLEDNFAEELALDIDERPDDVEVTLLYLLKTGLAETQDNKTFFFPYAIENTGSETASTIRSRESRARKALQCNTDATLLQQKCSVEIEKEIEKESEKEKESDDDDEDRFEEFWSAFPKKSGDIRQAYFEYLGAIQSGVSEDEILEAVKWQAKAKDQRYFPSAEKWLRNKGWTEKPEASEKKRSAAYMSSGEQKSLSASDWDKVINSI